MADIWNGYIERLKVQLAHPENLVLLVAELERIKNATGHGAVHLVIAEGRLQLITGEVKHKANSGLN